MPSSRWKIELKRNGTVVETLRNQTGHQLRRIRNAWADGKKIKGDKYFGTQLKFEEEPDLKRIK